MDFNKSNLRFYCVYYETVTINQNTMKPMLLYQIGRT